MAGRGVGVDVTYAGPNSPITLTGDATGTGTSTIPVTLATVTVAKGGTGATSLPVPAGTASVGRAILQGNGSGAVTTSQWGGWSDNISLACYNAVAAGSLGPYLDIARSRGTNALPTATQSGDVLGQIGFGGYGTAWSQGTPAYMQAQAAENFTGTAQGGRFTFTTTTPGTLTTAERVRIGVGLMVGTTTDSGVGTVNVSGGYYVGGVAIPNGTVTSITAGAGLTGGTITGIGTIALASPITASFLPGYTGDVTSPAGSTVNTLATVNTNIGTYNNVTINGKGLATAGFNVAYLTSSGVSGMTAGQLPVAATATTITSSTPYGTTGNNTVVQTGATGTLAAGVMPAYTGDVTSAAGTTANTLATVNSNIGTYNNITINGKGLATAGSNVAYLTAAVTSVATGTGLTGGTITGTGTISMANMAANSVKGNNTGAAAAPIDMTVAQTMTLLGAAPLASPAFTGNVTVSGNFTSGGSLYANNNPAVTLGVSGNYTVLYAPDGSVASRCLMLGNTASAGLNLHRNATHYFQDVSGATNFAQIDANGLVVGSPAGGSKGAGTVNATTVYAGGVALTSDARLKRDIAPLPDGCLRLVGAIAPKQFRFIEPPPQEAAGPHDLVPDGMTLTPAGPPGWFERRHWGFIAQEVQAAMTGHEFGGVDEDAAGNLALSPSDMVAVLWKAVQELSARLAALEGSGVRH